jgi:DNA-binding Lrp family transcriptional regulator
MSSWFRRNQFENSFVEVAKQVGASDTTVHARNKHLLNSGINNKFIISVNNNGLNRDKHKKSLTIPQTVMKF